MQPVEPQEVQSAINVTPLVDVVLVLLIIFMVVAPQMDHGPDVQLPVTDKPPKKTEDGEQILVAIEQGGDIWINRDRVAADEFHESILETKEKRGSQEVVIKGDARLSFGVVKDAMLAVEAAGFQDVGLIAERREDAG